MPGRQAHGRPVGGGSGGTNKGSKGKKNRSRSKANALDAFAIAAKMYEDKPKMTPRNRDLDVPKEGPRRGGKHARDEDDEDDEDDSEDEDESGRRPKRMRRGDADARGGAADGAEDEDVEYGSDSSGNEWRVGGDDSEIESDDAFGESDEERFEDFTFRGSKKQGSDEVREYHHLSRPHPRLSFRVMLTDYVGRRRRRRR